MRTVPSRLHRASISRGPQLKSVEVVGSIFCPVDILSGRRAGIEDEHRLSRNRNDELGCGAAGLLERQRRSGNGR